MNILILGATSDIAIEVAKRFARNGDNLQLAARNIEGLLRIKNDIEIKHQVAVDTLEFDARKFESHSTFYNSLFSIPDVVVVAFGFLGSHDTAIHDWHQCHEIIEANYTGAVSILNIIADDFEKRKQGTIVGISSVAGDRGRMSNYLYGSAKAGLTAYLSGLRNRLHDAGVHVLTVKPGFVRTKMTEGLPLPKPLTATAEQVAQVIIKAVSKKRNTVYVLPIWFVIMSVIKNIPEFIFKKLKL